MSLLTIPALQLMEVIASSSKQQPSIFVSTDEIDGPLYPVQDVLIDEDGDIHIIVDYI